MKIKLSSNEQRIIGCLIEKSLTTPDQYPLSLNALTNACNQKSNRDPVLSLSEGEVQDVIDSLANKHLVMTQSGATSRVAKYLHRFCNTEFSDLQLSPQELGISCVLLLRGAQTPGELRTRTNRLCDFNNVSETEEVLNKMMTNDPPLVRRLEREPGRRESRYIHCFGEQQEEVLTTSSDSIREAQSTNESILVENEVVSSSDQRIEMLEEKVELLELEIEELKEKLSKLL